MQLLSLFASACLLGFAAAAGTQCPSPSAVGYRTKVVTVVPSTSTTYVFRVSTSFRTTKLVATGTFNKLEFTTTTTPFTSTSTKIVVNPATKTVTIPTAAGFTPVLCQPEYASSTRTTTITQTVPKTVTSVIYAPWTQTSPWTEYTSYTWSTSTYKGYTDTIYIYPTVTVTSTRNEATKTVYDACATNNIVDKAPVSGYFGLVSDINESTIKLVRVPSVDAVDCCALCQANSTCSGSAYNIAEPVPCGIYIPLDQPNTCYPGTTKRQTAADRQQQSKISISNGKCGQYDLSLFIDTIY